MILFFLFKGLFLGLSVSAPVGPIGILCINRTLNKNQLSGFVSGMGAATADLIYGMIAGFGLTIVSNFLIDQKLWIQGVGLILLFYIGLNIILKKKKELVETELKDESLLRDYFSTFLLTITNPLTILLFLGAFAAMGLSNLKESHTSLFFLLSGVFIGSASWWLFLSRITHSLKTKITSKLLGRIDTISGSVICFIALCLLVDLTIQLF